MKDEKKHNKLVAKKARAATALNKANKLADGEETKGEDGISRTGLVGIS